MTAILGPETGHIGSMDRTLLRSDNKLEVNNLQKQPSGQVNNPGG